MLTAIMRSLRTGVVTIRYPAQPAQVPERFRGAPLPRPGSTFDALPPPSVCPAGAITGGDGGSRYAVDLGRCVFCGRCAECSPPGALEHGREVELAARSRESLVVNVERGGDGRATRPTASRIPKMIASGRGGQPGMKTSTGRTSATPPALA